MKAGRKVALVGLRALSILSIGVVLLAALMAAHELPEILTLTDNTSNDYVSVRAGSQSLLQGVLKQSKRQLPVASVALSLPARLPLATAFNLLFSTGVKSARTLLSLLVTQRK
jgi:hypothetical protein